MKNILPALGCVVASFAFPLFSQNSLNWAVTADPHRVFIENKGQFHIQNSSEKVLFAYQEDEMTVFFTEKGVHYTFLKTWREKKDDKEEERERNRKFKSVEEYKEFEAEEHRMKFKTDEVSYAWENANPAAKIVSEGEVHDYFSYMVKDLPGTYKNINYVKGFEKITYKDLYPGIDVEFTIHPDNGIKYSVIVHPGADPSVLKMMYTESPKLRENGDLNFQTKLGNLIEHAPVSFYGDNKSAGVTSSFIKDGKNISFSVGEYNHSRTLVIDPWVQSPTFGTTTWHTVWECEKDGAGNVYIIGGGASQSAGSQMMVKKYNSTGAIQWTYVTPYDTSNVWLGTFATDNAGNCYVTAGSVAQILKIDNAANLIWNNTNPGGAFSTSEFWNIVFNCDQSKLVIGGTGGSIFSLQACIYNVDVNTGNITSNVTVAIGNMSGFPPTVQEVRSISSCPNGKYYFMTHDTIGFINQNFTLCPNGTSTLSKIDNGIGFGYKCEDYRFDNSGIMSIRADANFLYVNRGNEIQKRSLATLAIIATATIPGGAFTSGFGGSQVSNSGIDIDNCGNIYVGSKNQVVKFSPALAQLATYATTFNVYDVHVSTAGDIIACGSTGTSGTGNRTGSIQSFAASACTPIALTCCDATLCSPGTYCIGDAPFNLTAATPGGTFSGPGITNSSTGTFSPAVAGVGTWTIVYTLACGSDSTTIKVNNCAGIPVCSNANGSITASGTGPFTWYQQTTGPGPCVPGAGFVCGPFTVAGPPVTTWTSFSSSATVTPTTYPVYVVNTAGDSAYVASFASLPSCTACSMTGSISSQTNVSCNGGTNGSATAAQAGGSGTITYSWTPSGGTAATASGLAAGSYTCTITAGSCTATATVTITQPAAMTTTVTAQTNVACNGASTGSATVAGGGGSGSYTYSWTPSGGSAATASSLAAGTYTCTVTSSGCNVTQTVTITEAAAILTPTSSVNSSCGGNTGSATVNASGGTGTLSYSWNPGGQTTSTASNLAAGTYTCTITDASTCTQTVSVAVNNNGGPTVNLSSQTNVACNGAATGDATVNASGGTGTLIYSWSPSGGTAATATGLSANTYTCTVTDGAGCIQTQTVTITQAAAILTPTTSVNASCGGSNGSATVNASGGTGTLTYSWAPGGQTTSTATSLAAGTYTCTVTDGSTCTQTVSVVVNTTGGPTVNLASQTNVLCNGSSTGIATVNASGGSGTLTYSWTPSGGTGATATGLAANTYTCTVTDGSGCVQTQTVTITQASAILTPTSSVNTSCGGNTGSATVNASGGTGTLGYLWSPGGQTTSTATNLTAGTYTCTITDGSACTQTVSVAVNSNGGPTVNLSTQANVTCFGGTNGSATINATGGTGTITYTWSPSGGTAATASGLTAGNYTCTVTDGAGCVQTQTVSITSPTTIATTTATVAAGCGQTNGSATVNASGGTPGYTYSWAPGGQTTSTASGLAAGSYVCTITDANTCTTTNTVIVTNSNGPTATAGVVSPSCVGWNISLNSTGGVTYSWTGPNGFTSTLQNPVISPGTIAASGVYSVTVTDAGGCTNTATVSVTVSPQPTVTMTYAANDTITLGQSVTLTAGGATTYVWDNASTASSIVITPTATGDYTYCVYGTNAAGCIDSQCVDIHVKKLDCGELFFPTAFSPNDDGANDQLCVYGQVCVTVFQLRIYDRWGERVFDSTDPSFCWDGTFKGKKLMPAVYAYYLNATLVSGEEVVLKGNVSLVK